MSIWGAPSRRSPLRLVAFSGLLLALLIAAVAPGRSLAADGEPAFCQTMVLHDYLAPFDRLPKLRELPFRRLGDPLFRGVHVASTSQPLIIGEGGAGYVLQWGEDDPGWDLTMEIARVNAEGTVLQALGTRRLGVDELAYAEPRLPLPRRPGLYRSTLVIRSSTGRKLTTFGNYYRIVKPRVDDRFVTSAPTYRPGETVLARLENPGLAFIRFGEGFDVEALQGTTWVPAPEALSSLDSPLVDVAPGTTSNLCLDAPLPETMPPGRYRLAQETMVSWPSLRAEPRPVLYAEFDVVAP